MTLIARAGTEIQRAGHSGLRPISKCQGPKTIDHQCGAVLRLQQALELTIRIEPHNRSAAKIADQQFRAALAEGSRRQSDAPRRIHFLYVAARVRARREAVKVSRCR